MSNEVKDKFCNSFLLKTATDKGNYYRTESIEAFLDQFEGYILVKQRVSADLVKDEPAARPAEPTMRCTSCGVDCKTGHAYWEDRAVCMTCFIDLKREYDAPAKSEPEPWAEVIKWADGLSTNSWSSLSVYDARVGEIFEGGMKVAWHEIERRVLKLLWQEMGKSNKTIEDCINSCCDALREKIREYVNNRLSVEKVAEEERVSRMIDKAIKAERERLVEALHEVGEICLIEALTHVWNGNSK